MCPTAPADADDFVDADLLLAQGIVDFLLVLA